MGRRRNEPAKWTLPAVINPEGRRCVMIEIPDERFHIAAFRGAMLHLAEAYKWADDPDHTAREVALVWRGIIDAMEWGCGVPEDECRNFTPAASFVTWEPQNPYTEPNLVPSGYILPPFYVVYDNTLPEWLGYEVGDVLTDLTRFYGGTGVITDPESGFARFRITVTGAGMVQIYFLNVPLGGMALVTQDGDPLSFSLVELQVDIIAFPIENNEQIIHEVTFDTEGEHFIDVTFVPRVDESITFFNYGGGIRKIKLCGFEEAEEAMVFDIRQKPDAPCIIQKTDNGVDWVDRVNMQLCPPKIRVNNGVIQWFNDDTGEWEDVDMGDEREDGDAPVPYPDDPDGACLAAENITAVYQSALTEIRAGITASRDLVAIAAGISGIMTAFMPIAIVTTIAFSLTAAALAVGGAGLDDMLDEESLENFKCSIFCEIAEDGSITAAAFTALRARMVDWAETVELEIINIWLDAFGSVGLQRQARAGGITTGDCGDCECVPPELDWHIWVDGGAEDSPNRAPFTEGFGATFSNPYGVEVGANEFEMVSGTIPNFGSGTTYYLFSIAIEPDPQPEGVFRVYMERTANNPNGDGSNQYIFNMYYRRLSDNTWQGATSGVGTITSIGVENVAFTYNLVSLPAYDILIVEIGSYAPHVTTRIEATPT